MVFQPNSHRRVWEFGCETLQLWRENLPRLIVTSSFSPFSHFWQDKQAAMSLARQTSMSPRSLHQVNRAETRNRSSFFFFFFVARWSPPVRGGQIFIRRLVLCEGGEAGGRPQSSIAAQCDIDWNKRGHGLTRDRPHHSPHAPLHLDHVESRSVQVAVSLLCFTFSPQPVKHCAEETSVALTAQTALHPDYQSACGQMVSDELSANTYAHTQKCFSPNTPSLSLISHSRSSRVKKIVYSWGLECLQLRGRRTQVHREDLTVQPDVCGHHRIFVKSRGLIISTYHLFL